MPHPMLRSAWIWNRKAGLTSVLPLTDWRVRWRVSSLISGYVARGITVSVSALPRGATAEQALADGVCELVFSYWPPEMSALSTRILVVNDYWLAVPSQAPLSLWPVGVKPDAGESVSLTELPDLPVG